MSVIKSLKIFPLIHMPISVLYVKLLIRIKFRIKNNDQKKKKLDEFIFYKKIKSTFYLK
jgi:hypothetical protein